MRLIDADKLKAGLSYKPLNMTMAEYIDNAPTAHDTVNLYPSGTVIIQERPQASNNAELFKQIFGIYATEVWSMNEADFLEWLNSEVTE